MSQTTNEELLRASQDPALAKELLSKAFADPELFKKDYELTDEQLMSLSAASGADAADPGAYGS